MGVDAEDEEEDEDADNGGNAAAPPVPVEMVLEQEAHVAHEVILADAEPKLPQPHLYRMLMRDYEESPSRMMDDLDDQNEGHSDMDEWFPEDGSNDQD
jgi:hypothetical protein